MAYDLFSYQKTGAQWLAGRRYGLLADEMGLGKSAQAITAADLIKAERIGVVCPASLRTNWLREFAAFSNSKRSCAVIHTSQYSPPIDANTWIVSPDLLLKNSVSGLLADLDVVILDEAHYYKSLDAQRTLAVYGRQGVVRRAKRAWLLTGTPMPNHPGELWPMCRTFGLTDLGYDAWLAEFCRVRHTPYGTQIEGARKENIPRLKEILQPFYIRRTKEEVMPDLPPIKMSHVYVEPGPVDWEIEFPEWWMTGRMHQLHDMVTMQAAAMEQILALKRDGHNNTDPLARAIEALAVNSAQVRRVIGLQKVHGVVEMLKTEFESGLDKVVLFAHHRGVIEGLRYGLREFKPVTLYGGTPPEKKQANIDRFQKDPKCRVFIGNIQAAGVGVTLTACHQVMMVEPDWVPGNNAQAIMRCHRIGQTRPVFVRWVNIAGSIDEKIQNILNRKTQAIVETFN